MCLLDIIWSRNMLFMLVGYHSVEGLPLLNMRSRGLMTPPPNDGVPPRSRGSLSLAGAIFRSKGIWCQVFDVITSLNT